MKTLLILSLAANLLLAGWLAVRISAAGGLQSAPPAGRTTNAASLAPRTDRVVAPSAPANSHGAEPDAPLQWEGIASEDPRVYCRNLRALGCPEHVIRELVIAQVNQKHRTEILPLLRQLSANFWERTSATKTPRKVALERETELRARLDGIERSRRNLLEELFGDTWKNGRDHAFPDKRDEKRLLSFLPEHKLDKAIAWDTRHDEALMSIYRQNLPESERDTLLAWTRADLEQEARQLFTPDEWEEYQLRKSKYAHVPGNLYGIDLSPDEIRALVRLHDKHDVDNSPALQAELKTLLGDERFAELQRAQDRAFADLYRVALRLDLPKEAAVEAYQTRQALQQAAERARSSAAPEPIRRAQLAALRSEAEAGLLQILGKDGFEIYLRHGGWWIQQLENVK